MLVRRLGHSAYQPTLDAMRVFTAARSSGTPDELWLVEHPPVYTLGLAGKREHLLRDTGIPVMQTDRGGQITYHGPGQVIVYVLVDLKRNAIKVREFVHAIESAVINTLAAYNLHGVRIAGAPGIYLQARGELEKIAALGLKIKNGCSYHGVSLNVDMDLTPFLGINPCGYPGLRTTDMMRHGVRAGFDEVATRLARDLTVQLAELPAKNKPLKQL